MRIKPLALEIFEARRVGKAQQVAHGEDQLAEAEGIGRMNIALHHLVVYQPVDDVGAFPLGGAEHGGVPQQVALVTEGVGGYALNLCRNI